MTLFVGYRDSAFFTAVRTPGADLMSVKSRKIPQKDTASAYLVWVPAKPLWTKTDGSIPGNSVESSGFRVTFRSMRIGNLNSKVYISCNLKRKTVATHSLLISVPWWFTITSLRVWSYPANPGSNYKKAVDEQTELQTFREAYSTASSLHPLPWRWA